MWLHGFCIICGMMEHAQITGTNINWGAFLPITNEAEILVTGALHKFLTYVFNKTYFHRCPLEWKNKK